MTAEYISNIIVETIDTLSNHFLDVLEKFFSRQQKGEYFVLVALLIVWLIITFCFFHLYFKRLNKKIWLSQGMLSILPYHTIINDDELYRMINQWRNI